MPLFGRRRDSERPLVERTERPALPAPPADTVDGLRAMADHRDYLLTCVDPLPPFSQQLLDAVGLCLCEDVSAAVDLPGFDNSAMDGYAVQAHDVETASSDSPVRLPVVGEIAAGQVAPHRLSPGSAMKIMTGAPLPPGADAVVPYEATDRGEREVAVVEPSVLGQHVRRRGEDVAAGTVVLREGQRLGPRAIGLLAGIGLDKVTVRPRPRVVVVSTGTELVQPGHRLSSDREIYDSNSYLLAAAAKAAGAQVFRVGLVDDDPAAVKQLISDQLVRADLILTSGGISEGDYDVIKQVMPELGATDFARVAMQPGKPQGFGLIGEDRVPMIMLPGNPVSSFVSFEAFVRPVIRRLMGATPYEREPVRCRAAHPMRSLPNRLQFARGLVESDRDGGRAVSLVGGPGSHLLGGLARANALVLLAEDVDFVAQGDEVDVWLLGDE